MKKNEIFLLSSSFKLISKQTKIQSKQKKHFTSRNRVRKRKKKRKQKKEKETYFKCCNNLQEGREGVSKVWE